MTGRSQTSYRSVRVDRIAAELARREALLAVLDALATANVEVVVFKGSHLAYECYSEPWLRARGDTDLLIDEGDQPAAARVLGETGHRLVPHVRGRFVMAQRHYLDGGPLGPFAYDVHWRVVNPMIFARVLPAREIIAAARPLPALGRSARVPSRVHALLIACVHRVAHHQAWDHPVWLEDIRALLQGLSSSEIDSFCSLADERAVNAICLHGLASAAEMFPDVVVPDRLRAGARRRPGVGTAYLRRMTGFHHVWLELTAIGSWRARWAYLRELGLPTRAEMRHVHGVSATALPWAYASRLVRGGGRWLFHDVRS